MNTKLRDVFKGKVVNKAHTNNTGVDDGRGYRRSRTGEKLLRGSLAGWGAAGVVHLVPGSEFRKLTPEQALE